MKVYTSIFLALWLLSACSIDEDSILPPIIPASEANSINLDNTCINLCDLTSNSIREFSNGFVNFEHWQNSIYDECKFRYDFGNLFSSNPNSYIGEGRTYLINNQLKIEYPDSVAGSAASGITASASIFPKKEYTLYYRIWFDSNFEWKLGGKLPGFCGGVCNSGCQPVNSSNNGWSVRLLYKSHTDPEGDLAYVEPYVYHHGMNQNCGVSFNQNSASNSVFLQKNQWNGVQLYVKLNDAGSSNGKLKVWINDQVAFDIDNVEYQAGDLDIERFLLHIFPGGGNELIYSPSVTTHVRLNEIKWW